MAAAALDGILAELGLLACAQTGGARSAYGTGLAASRSGASLGPPRTWTTGKGEGEEDRVSIPSASLCSETLSAVADMLPCRTSAGIGALLVPQRVFSSEWVAIGLSASRNRTARDDDDDDDEEGEGTLSLHVKISASVPPPPPTPHSIAGIYGGSNVLAALGIPAEDSAALDPCPVASSASAPSISLPHAGWGTDEEETRLRAALPRWAGSVVRAPPPGRTLRNHSLEIQRHVSPLSLGSGSIRYAVRGGGGAGGREVVEVIVEETLPWMFVRDPSSLVAWDDASGLLLPASLAVTRPASRRGPAGKAEIRVALPLPPAAASAAGPAGRPVHVHVAYRYTTELLHAEEFPPDAHRGFDIPPARARLEVEGEKGWDAARCAPLTRASTVELPAPDFSMPYNVVTLVSTALAFTLGTLINVLARRPRVRGTGQGG
jgi:phosphatidylinositol glycan class T